MWRLLGFLAVGLAIALLAFFEILDVSGRLDILEKKYGRLWRIANNRPARLFILVLCAGFLAKDIKDATGIPEPPVVKLQPPVISMTPSLVVSGGRESKDSLRKRTLRLADELEAFDKERNDKRMNISTSRDEAGRAPFLQSFDIETSSLYVSRGLKEKSLGIIQELKS